MTKSLPGKTVQPQVEWRTVRTSVITALITVLLIDGLPWVFREARDRLREEPPIRLSSQGLASVIGNEVRVVDRDEVDLDGDKVDEVVAVAVQAEGGLGRPPQWRVVIAAWDRETERWGSVFDSAEFRVFRNVRDEATEEAFLPPGVELEGEIERLYLRRTSGRDVAVGAQLLHGRERLHTTLVLRYEDELVKAMFNHTQLGEGDIEIFRDEQDRERLRFTADWQLAGDFTEYSFRKFVFDVGVIGGEYLVVDDKRPFLGATVATDDVARLVVVETIEGSPAHGVLQPGDEIWGAPDLRPDDEIGPDELLRAITNTSAEGVLRLTVWRDDSFHDISIQLRERGAMQPYQLQPPWLPDIGLNLEAGDPGAFVEAVEPGSSVDRAGIPRGSAIERVGGRRITYPADVWFALHAAPPEERSALPVTYSLDGDPRPEKSTSLDTTFSAATAGQQRDWPPPLITL